MSKYNVVMEMSNSTVVTEYKPVQKRSDSYQSEATLEREFIKMLEEQGYDYLQIHDSNTIINNLRKQLELLNKYNFTDNEWERFFNDNICNNNDGIVEKTRKIQEDNIQVLKRDDGTSKNITLIDKKCIHNNRLQVINQYEENDGSYKNRYDVTILVNGFPLVHVELKRRGVALKEAFNQINRYQRESFWIITVKTSHKRRTTVSDDDVVRSDKGGDGSTSAPIVIIFWLLLAHLGVHCQKTISHNHLIVIGSCLRNQTGSKTKRPFLYTLAETVRQEASGSYYTNQHST